MINGCTAFIYLPFKKVRFHWRILCIWCVTCLVMLHWFVVRTLRHVFDVRVTGLSWRQKLRCVRRWRISFPSSTFSFLAGVRWHWLTPQLPKQFIDNSAVSSGYEQKRNYWWYPSFFLDLHAWCGTLGAHKYEEIRHQLPILSNSVDCELWDMSGHDTRMLQVTLCTVRWTWTADSGSVEECLLRTM
jgi:hypothetical protein